MLHQEFDPPEALRDSIKCFWYNSRDVGEQPSNFEVLPDGYAEIIFHFGSACHIFCDGLWQPLPSPFVMGLQNQPAQLSTIGRLQVIGIRCFPWTVFDLLGLPSGKKGARIAEHPVAQLHATLATLIDAEKIDEALAQVQRYFLTARAQIALNGTSSRAGTAMQGANGNMPVSEVAAVSHASVRTLERKFKQSSGFTVKDVSALMRFEQARNRLWLFPDSNLADLAQTLGYTDQSHLSREFKKFSGTTPAAFARKARNEQRAVGNDVGVFIQA